MRPTRMMWFHINRKLRGADLNFSSKFVITDDRKMPAHNQTAPNAHGCLMINGSGEWVRLLSHWNHQLPDLSSSSSFSVSSKMLKQAEVESEWEHCPKVENECHCSLALFSGGCLLGGTGAEDLVPGSLSSCFTASVGASGSFFTSTAIQKHSSISVLHI